jgi:hypothetical protein
MSRHKLDSGPTQISVVRAVRAIAILAIVADLAILTRFRAAIARPSFRFRYFRHRCSSLPRRVDDQ